MPNNQCHSGLNPAGSAHEAAFVATLNQLRRMAGHTYRQLGRMTGVPPSTLHDTLTSRRRPRPEVIRAIAQVYAADDDQAELWLAHWNSFDDPGDAEPGSPTPEPAGDDGPPTGAGRPRGPLSRLLRPVGRWRLGQVATIAVLMTMSAGAGSVGTLLLLPSSPGAQGRATSQSTGLPLVTTSTTVLTVYNAEVPCQQLRTVECGLGLFRDPRNADQPDSIVSRVYHGDHIEALCVIENGRFFADESGVSTFRWYKVIVPSTTEIAWLAAVRTRSTVEVSRC